MKETSKNHTKREQNKRYLLLLLAGVILLAAVAVTVILININQPATTQPEKEYNALSSITNTVAMSCYM